MVEVAHQSEGFLQLLVRLDPFDGPLAHTAFEIVVRTEQYILSLLALGNIHARADEGAPRAIGVAQGNPVVEHPAPFSVVAAVAVLHLKFRARLNGVAISLEAAFPIPGMDILLPAITLFLGQSAPDKIEPRPVEPGATTVVSGDPHQDGRRVGHLAKSLLAAA